MPEELDTGVVEDFSAAGNILHTFLFLHKKGRLMAPRGFR